MGYGCHGLAECVGGVPAHRAVRAGCTAPLEVDIDGSAYVVAGTFESARKKEGVQGYRVPCQSGFRQRQETRTGRHAWGKTEAVILSGQVLHQ